MPECVADDVEDVTVSVIMHCVRGAYFRCGIGDVRGPGTYVEDTVHSVVAVLEV